MKKIIMCSLSAAILLVLCACGTGGKSTPDPEEILSGDYTIDEKIDAVYALSELDTAKAAEAAYTLLTDSLTSPGLWDYSRADGEGNWRHAENVVHDYITLIENAGRENAGTEIAEKLAQKGLTGFDFNQRLNTVRPMLTDYPDLYEDFMPVLIESGWFDNDQAEYEGNARVSAGAIGGISAGYISSSVSATEAVERYHFICRAITPLIAERYADGVNLTACWTAYDAPFDSIAFDEYMPALSSDPAENDGTPKYLIVSRASGGDDDHGWQIEGNLQALVPEKYSPVGLDGVTALIVLDSTWVYDSDYTNGSQGYGAQTHVAVYGFASGGLITDLGLVETPSPALSVYSGDPPKIIYATPDLERLFVEIASGLFL